MRDSVEKTPPVKDLALFLPSLRGGGAERVMMLLARGFAERGLKVDLVLAKAEGGYLEAVPSSVHVEDLNAGRVLSSLPALVRYLRREKPRAMLAAMDHANLVALAARRIAGTDTRVVGSVHNTISEAAEGSTHLLGRLVPRLVGRLYPRLDGVVAVSQGVADDLIATTGLSRSRVSVIHNALVTSDLLDQAAEPVEHPWFAPGEPPVVLGVGRLAPQKNFPVLLRAFAAVRRRRPARLMILGEGPERGSLEALAAELGVAEDVALPGHVSNPFAYMRAAAVFALSSLYEGCPNVLIEAIACGCSIVSADCPSGPQELLEGGRFGILVPVGDHQALAEGILHKLEQPSDKAALRTRAMDFSLPRGVEQYLSLLLPEHPTQSGGATQELAHRPGTTLGETMA